jgi:phosphatidylglycerophosphate synthase
MTRPSLAELRAVAQPPTVLGRVSGEHWAGALYMRRLSIRLTRVLVPTRISPNALTWSMIPLGLAAAVLVALPHWWTALIAVLLVQAQLLVDCSDGELARWRGATGATGIYVDRLAHYVTDAGLVVAVGVHADGGFGSIAGWTTLGLAAGLLALLSKAETDLVHASRAASGLPPAPDDASTAAPRRSLLRRLRRLATTLPVNRALLAIELSVLVLVASIADSATATFDATRVLTIALVAIAGYVVVGHLASIVSSGRLR